MKMSKRTACGLAATGLMAGMALPASAASENMGWSDPGSNFSVGVSGACGASSGFRFQEDNSYSFDDGGLVTVNGTYIGSGGTSFDLTTVGSDAVATYPETGTQFVGDLAVTVSFRFTSADIVRTLVTITNTGLTDVTAVPVNIENDYGDNFGVFHVEGGTWRPSGTWFVTADTDSANANDYNYGPIFHLIDGPGSPESPATYALCNGTLIDESTPLFEDSAIGYLVDIPAGATRRIVVIQGSDVGGTVSSATTKAQTYDPASQTPGSGILSDLSAEDACTVVNWVFEGCGSSGGGSFPNPDYDYYMSRTDLPNTR